MIFFCPRAILEVEDSSRGPYYCPCISVRTSRVFVVVRTQSSQRQSVRQNDVEACTAQGLSACCQIQSDPAVLCDVEEEEVSSCRQEVRVSEIPA